MASIGRTRHGGAAITVPRLVEPVRSVVSTRSGEGTIATSPVRLFCQQLLATIQTTLMSQPNATPVVMPITAEQLPDDPEQLKRMTLELLDSMRELQHDRDALQHRLGLLLQRLYGPRGERFDPAQP